MINIKMEHAEMGADGGKTRNPRTELKKGRGLPKNIRQVGDIPQGDRIYIEDYVVTYLNQLAHPANRIAKGAILLGEWSKEGRKDILYISGAVEADNLSFDMKEITFTNETWSEIHQKIEDNFPGEQVVGWFLSRLGYSVALEKEMEDCHKVNFKGEKTVLYLMDALEQEDAFYLFEKDKATRLSGYYIYYERNTPMQEYLIEHHAQYSKQDEDHMAYKDSQVLHSYHEIMAGRRARKEQKQVTRLLYVTSAMLTLVFLALGITVFNNYDRIKRIQSALEFLSNETGAAQVNEVADSDSEQDLVQAADHMDASQAAGKTNALGGEIGDEAADSKENADAQEANGAERKDGTANASESGGDAQASGSDTNDNGTNALDASGSNGAGTDNSGAGASSENANATETVNANAVSNGTKIDNNAAVAANQTANESGEGDADNNSVAASNPVSGTKNSTGEVMQATSSNVANYYTVQNGDTLLSICQKVYHSDAYVDLVKRANELENGDVIYPGQQIVLPSID